MHLNFASRLIAGAALVFLVWAPAVAQNGHLVSGVVSDSSGAVVANANVALLTASQSIVRTARTNGQGRFGFEGLQPGRYLLVVTFPGFAERRLAVDTAAATSRDLKVTLEVEGVRAEVTVTASPGLVQETRGTTQPVNVIDSREIAERTKAVVAQAAAEETGVHLLRTAPVMAGIYVRGLTGAKVNAFVDGVRYSTSAARGGVNTFLDLVEPTALEGIEVLRGPNSAQYGSDALGGSVQFLSQGPTFSSGARPWHGAFLGRANSADQSYGGNLSAGYSASRFGLFVNLAGRRINTIRPGEGIDSHAAITRFFGLASTTLMDERLPDTAFTQYGGVAKSNWAPTSNDQLIVYYQRSQQDGAKRYDQLLGGDGNLVADLRNLMLDLGYVRYNRVGLGWFDQLSVTWSVNSQREERVNQGGNGNPRAAINHEYERTTALGFQARASKRWAERHDIVVGGDFYPEGISAPSFAYNPVTGASTVRRGRVPDGATYRSYGVFVQDASDVVPNRLKLAGSLRWSGISYRSLASDSPIVSGKPLWPDDEATASNVSFRAGAVMALTDAWTVSGNVSRGFRAPSMTDLGTIGLTGSGYQVSATGVEGRGATVGSTADAKAVSTGRPVEQVDPETSLSYEAAAQYRSGRLHASFAFFLNRIADNIAYQSLILPQGAVGTMLGDQVITAQLPNGVVYVPVASNPVLVRANFDNARILGVEHSLDWQATSRWSVGTVFTYMHAKDTATGNPPNIEGGTPAPDAYIKLRYLHPGGRFWIVPYIHIAARQPRLSTLDLEDRRTGATRTRSSIRSFFLNGATARGWVNPGPDGVTGTADDLLTETGETLAQIQDRVLGIGVTSSPLVTEIPGYVTFAVRGGVRLGPRQELTIDIDNLGDTNYRGIAWGVDAPGFGIAVGYRTTF